MRVAFGVIGAIALVFTVVVTIFAISWGTAPIRGKLQARQEINSGAFRIAAYNHFFDLCAAVQTDDIRLDAQATELASATGDDIQRVQANIAGITADRSDAINEYNADAQKDYTVGQFKSSKLPWQISTRPHVTGRTVSCAA